MQNYKIFLLLYIILLVQCTPLDRISVSLLYPKPFSIWAHSTFWGNSCSTVWPAFFCLKKGDQRFILFLQRCASMNNGHDVCVQSTKHSLINMYIHEVHRTSNKAGKCLYKEFATERYELRRRDKLSFCTSYNSF